MSHQETEHFCPICGAPVTSNAKGKIPPHRFRAYNMWGQLTMDEPCMGVGKAARYERPKTDEPYEGVRAQIGYER